MADSPFHLFGVRHHGPGCARSLRQALEALNPDCLLIEGPPEGEPLLPFMLNEALVPPVALLVFNPDDAKEAVFYPFAHFSPEWQALQYGLQQGIPTRFMDLPVSHSFALRQEQTKEAATVIEAPPSIEPVATEAEMALDFSDPLDWLGRAAGYDSGESWWNHMVEERCDGLELFTAIREAMVTVRAEAPKRQRSKAEDEREILREATMRKTMRQAQKEGFERIAVICGAWHVPALEQLPSAKADNDLLKSLPKTKVSATWVPWSYQNLSFQSGYGAGVASPAWYEHIWQIADGRARAIHWLTKAAHLLRAEDIDCSSAHIIEAIRLAESLAAMCERPQVGLDELLEAMRTTVCMGDSAPLKLIEQQLIVGSKLGQIPAEVPMIPLQRDLEQQQKSLRLKADPAQKLIDLDLRQENDLARSHLLHRLNLLDINWGRLNKTGRSAKGSFHEIWTLQWEPTFAIDVINASRWGNSVETAASAKVVDTAQQSKSLSQISSLMNAVLLADLPNAIVQVSHVLEDMAATVADIGELLDTIPPLTQIARYGNVRNTDVTMVEHLLQSLIPRAAIALPGACSSLDDDAAKKMREQIIQAHQSIRLLDQEDLSSEWLGAIHQLAFLGKSHGLICGLAARLLFDTQTESSSDINLRMSQALSLGNEPNAAAAWLEGFLNNSGMILLHDEGLWSLLNDWLIQLNDEHFLQILPLLRRTFSGFSSTERRQLGERASNPVGKRQTEAENDLNLARAEQTLPLLRQLLGLSS